MKNMRTSIRQILLLALVLTFISSTVFVNAASVTINQTITVTPLEDSGVDGRVLWEQGIIEAMGLGVAPEGITNPAQRQALARRAAVVDAQRNLLEQVNGVQIDSSTSVQQLALQSDSINSRVSGMIRGAQVVKNISQPDGSYV